MAGSGTVTCRSWSGDPSLLTSLFENLIGNAIKYRGQEPPLVVVTAAADRKTGEWTFAVKDNGIGIDPQYAERIFAIFQRLHVRDAYPGTGIGLALCRKIVEFHGGRIWLDTVCLIRCYLPVHPPRKARHMSQSSCRGGAGRAGGTR